MSLYNTKIIRLILVSFCHSKDVEFSTPKFDDVLLIYSCIMYVSFINV